MKNEQTAVIKDMEFLLNELHKEWERPGEVKSSVSIPYEKVEEISRKLNVIVYETQQSADSDGLAFKQSIAKSKQCYVLLRIMRKIVKGNRCKSRGAGKTAGYGKAGGLNGKEVKNTAETITGYTECIIQSV